MPGYNLTHTRRIRLTQVIFAPLAAAEYGSLASQHMLKVPAELVAPHPALSAFAGGVPWLLVRTPAMPSAMSCRCLGIHVESGRERPARANDAAVHAYGTVLLTSCSKTGFPC